MSDRRLDSMGISAYSNDQLKSLFKRECHLMGALLADFKEQATINENPSVVSITSARKRNVPRETHSVAGNRKQSQREVF